MNTMQKINYVLFLVFIVLLFVLNTNNYAFKIFLCYFHFVIYTNTIVTYFDLTPNNIYNIKTLHHELLFSLHPFKSLITYLHTLPHLFTRIERSHNSCFRIINVFTSQVILYTLSFSTAYNFSYAYVRIS